MGACIRRIAAGLLSLVLVLWLAVPARAAEEKPETYIRQILNYYRYYQQEAQTDIRILLDRMARVDPAGAEIWENIVDQWGFISEEMQVCKDSLPDGLPEDDSLCIVVMGYCLNRDGSMQRELIRRLEVALRSAQKYPNAYILCTGGATSAGGNITEAGAMARWLEKQGISKERIIEEPRAMSTTQNAIKSCKLLAADYPQVKSLALITSDYHIYQSCVLFAGMSAYCGGGMEVVGSAVYHTGAGSQVNLLRQARYLSELAGVEVGNMGKPVLSQLTGITAEYDNGFTVTAHYDSGFTRDVTDEAVVVWYDAHTEDRQEIAITYVEKGVPAIYEMYMERAIPLVRVYQEETEPVEIPQAQPSTDPTPAVLAIGAAWLLLILMMKARGWLK